MFKKFSQSLVGFVVLNSFEAAILAILVTITFDLIGFEDLSNDNLFFLFLISKLFQHVYRLQQSNKSEL